MNTFYFLIITITSVGYGDYYPVTLMGQSMAFFIFILGTFIVSLCFIILLTSLEMNHKERNALNLIKKLNLNGKVKHHSARAITDFFRLIKLYKRKRRKAVVDKSDPEIKSVVNQMLRNLKMVNSLRKKKKNFMQNDLIKDLTDSNEYSMFYLKEIENKQIYMLSKLIQIKEDLRRGAKLSLLQSMKLHDSDQY